MYVCVCVRHRNSSKIGGTVIIYFYDAVATTSPILNRNHDNKGRVAHV